MKESDMESNGTAETGIRPGHSLDDMPKFGMVFMTE